MAKQNKTHAKGTHVRSHDKGTALTGSRQKRERPISNAYPVIDNDLARDNIENDSPAANLQDI